MAQRIAFEIIVQVGMGIEMQDVHGAMDLGKACDDRISDHMIAAEE